MSEQKVESKSVTEEQAKRTAAFINEALEPKIAAMVEEANKILRKRGIRIGCEVQWFIDKHEEKENEAN